VAGGAGHSLVYAAQGVVGGAVVEVWELPLRLVDVVAGLAGGRAELLPVGVVMAVGAGAGLDRDEVPVLVTIVAAHLGVLAFHEVVGRGRVRVIEDARSEWQRLPVDIVVAQTAIGQQRAGALARAVGLFVAAAAGSIQPRPAIFLLGVAVLADQRLVGPVQAEAGGLVVEGLFGELDHLEVGAAVVRVTALAAFVSVSVEAPSGLNLLGHCVVAGQAALRRDPCAELVALRAGHQSAEIGVGGGQGAGADEAPQSLRLGWRGGGAVIRGPERHQRKAEGDYPKSGPVPAVLGGPAGGHRVHRVHRIGDRAQIPLLLVSSW